MKLRAEPAAHTLWWLYTEVNTYMRRNIHVGDKALLYD